MCTQFSFSSNASATNPESRNAVWILSKISLMLESRKHNTSRSGGLRQTPSCGAFSKADLKNLQLSVSSFPVLLVSYIDVKNLPDGEREFENMLCRMKWNNSIRLFKTIAWFSCSESWK